MAAVDMQIVVVSAADGLIYDTVVKSKERLEEARAYAVAANEKMFEAYCFLDPDEIEYDPENFEEVTEAILERKKREKKIRKCDADAANAWAAYEKALLRYGYDLATAAKRGIIVQ